MRKSSTCGFDFTDYGMLGGSRPGPVNRHGFEIAGSAGARLAPIMGPAPAGWSLGGWRPVGWKRKPASGGTRDALGAPGRRAAASAAVTPSPAVFFSSTNIGENAGCSCHGADAAQFQRLFHSKLSHALQTAVNGIVIHKNIQHGKKFFR